MKILGIITYLWGFVFGVLETRYFGNNFTPQSKEELICDLTSLFLCIIGFFIVYNSRGNR